MQAPALQKTKRPDRSRGAKNRQGCRTTLQKKASSAEPGRTFLQHSFYQGRTALVKKKVSNGAEWRKRLLGNKIRGARLVARLLQAFGESSPALAGWAKV